MVKICPKCGTKNFDDSRFCRKCFIKIKKIPVTRDEPLKDEFDYSYSKGYSVDIAARNFFTIPGIVSGLVAFFILPWIFGILAFALGINAVFRGDRLGIVAVALGFISIFGFFLF